MTDKRFFCLRGFMKSGTNWLGDLLSSHEEISVVGEFHWQEIVARFNQNQKSLWIYRTDEFKNATRQHLEEMIRRCMIDAADPNATVIGDRTPHGLLPVTLRGVPHISIIRDGRDVLVSRLFHLYNYPNVTGLFDRVPEMADNLKEFRKDALYFQKHPEKLLCHQPMVIDSIKWWKAHLLKDEQTVSTYPNLRVKFVKYEELHRDTHGQRAELFDFLDVDPNRAGEIEGMLKPGFENEQPSQFFRKGAIGDWKNYFNDQTKTWFNEIAGQELIKYGYVDSMDW